MNCDAASVRVLWFAWTGGEPSVAVVVHLKILVVKLLLGLVEFAQLLCLSFTDLLPFSIMSGEALWTRNSHPELLLQAPSPTLY